MKILIKSILILTVLSTFFAGILLAYKMGQDNIRQEYHQKSHTTYFFINPEIVDPKINATSDLYIKGEIAPGSCVAH